MLHLPVLVILAVAATAGCGEVASQAPVLSDSDAQSKVDATPRGLAVATLRHFSASEVAWYGGSGRPGEHVDTALSLVDGMPVKTLIVSASRSAIPPDQYQCGTDTGYSVQTCDHRADAVEEVLVTRVRGARPAVIARRVTARDKVTVLAWPQRESSVPLALIRKVLRDPAIALDGTVQRNREGGRLPAFRSTRGVVAPAPMPPQ